jgi:hypothetical protein
MSQESLPVVPACMHLRSKNMYVSGTMDPARDDYEFSGDGYCWCGKTQHPLGPDDKFVERPLCSVPERTCYERIV